MQLRHEMPNGASVKDWLGTAGLAARMADRHIEDLRTGADGDAATLGTVLEYLRQAVDEVVDVARALGVSTGSIHDEFARVRNHPDFAGGAVWSTQDVADALLARDADFETEAGDASTVTEEQREQSIKAMEHYIFSGIYGWDDAMRDNVDAPSVAPD